MLLSLMNYKSWCWSPTNKKELSKVGYIRRIYSYCTEYYVHIFILYSNMHKHLSAFMIAGHEQDRIS